MNKVTAIILLVLLALILILVIRALIPAFTDFLRKLPKGIFILLILVIIGMMAYLIRYLVVGEKHGGQQENAMEEQTDDPSEEGPGIYEHCIIIRGDKIWINNGEADLEQVEKYIDEHVLSKTELVIADDYSTASLHHEITALCDKKGVRYRTENEEWLER